MYELSLNDNGMTFKDLERKIYKYACDEACKTLKEILEALDEKLLNERDSKVYRNKGRKQTCLRTIMGDVEYSRRIYEFELENGKKATKYLLDEYLGMDTVGVVQNVGQKIKELEDRKIELNDKGVLKGEIETPVLFQEQDGVWLYMQGKDRPKGKNKKKELKVAVAYTGWKLREGSNKEHIVVNKTVCASFDSSKHFKKLTDATIEERYNIDEIETIILNGDGAKWIKATCEEQDIHFQLDPFHISQAILRNVANKKDQKELINFFRHGKVDEGLNALVNIMITNNEDEKAFKKLTTLYDYLVSNRDGLVPYHMRDDIKMLTPPEGIEYKSLGTMEHNICDVIAQRMKGRKMSWSISGANNLAKILSEKFSNRIFETVDKIYRNIIPNEVIESITTSLPLTPSKVNKETKKTKIYKCPSAQIPYSGAAITIGRKIIRDLCGLKQFSDISYN